ncbi:MAG: metalloregulator ArsR/SmtB family transcription factor [Wenzhouxiangella sp.]|jgi:DNA-binding transcriptional ArsR family regulator|nr:metalloregulator ArsR/SmtB family transcription factor [Wenzhouxiangella sp.]
MALILSCRPKIDADQIQVFMNPGIIAPMDQPVNPVNAVNQFPKPPPEEMAEHAEEAAQFLKLMANPHRLMILCHLLDGEMSVGELNSHLPLSQSALSQHLAVLRNSDIVKTRRNQQVIFYSLSSDQVRAVMAELYQQFCRPHCG